MLSSYEHIEFINKIARQTTVAKGYYPRLNMYQRGSTNYKKGVVLNKYQVISYKWQVSCYHSFVDT